MKQCSMCKRELLVCWDTEGEECCDKCAWRSITFDRNTTNCYLCDTVIDQDNRDYVIEMGGKCFCSTGCYHSYSGADDHE